MTLRAVAISITSMNAVRIVRWKLRRTSSTCARLPSSISVRSTVVKPPRSMHTTVSLTR
jgi:hypothetical protein